MPRSTIALVAAALLLTSSCQKSLPTGPSELVSGIIVYEHANFQGASAHLVTSVADLKDFKGPCERAETVGGAFGTPVSAEVHHEWNDCVSSIRVAPGWRARVYRDDDYSGQSFETATDVPNLQLVPGTCDHEGMNDCITSIRLFPPS